MKPRISIIAAVARNRAIGLRNKLLYWLPDDMKRFRNLTTGHTIVMGRRTFESLPKGALPRRRNIVLSRHVENADEARDSRFPGCDCYTSLAKALASCGEEEEVFVIGGESIYRQAIGLADRLLLTLVDDEPAEADAFFPDFSNGWQETWREDHQRDDRHAFDFAFVDYVRAGNG